MFFSTRPDAVSTSFRLTLTDQPLILETIHIPKGGDPTRSPPFLLRGNRPILVPGLQPWNALHGGSCLLIPDSASEAGASRTVGAKSDLADRVAFAHAADGSTMVRLS